MPRPGEYQYDEKSARYKDAAGRFLSRQQIRDELDAALRSVDRYVQAVAEAFRAKRTDLRTFEIALKQAIKEAHLFSAAAARGGWAQMHSREYGQVGGFIGREYLFLERFIRDIRILRQPTDGRFLQRVRLYVEAGRDTFHQAERDVMVARGMTEEKNILHPAEHCEGPGSCVEQRDRRWVRIGLLIPIGRRRCTRNCKCTIIYRRAG